MNPTQLFIELNKFMHGISNGDKYQTSNPEKEKGLQLELYMFLKQQCLIVDELDFPNLKPYLDKVLNEEQINESQKDALRADLVLKFDDGSYGCIEIKYNETDKKQLEEDAGKSVVYVQQCSDVSFACYIHLYKHGLKEWLNRGAACKDKNYEYSIGFYPDTSVSPEKGLEKSYEAYPIKPYWEKRLEKIKAGKGEFAEYENV